MEYTLTKEDKLELEYLRRIARRNLKSETRSISVIGEKQGTLLDAIRDGEAERTGIDVNRKINGVDPVTGDAIEFGFLERELGVKKNGTCFRFKRVYRMNGIVYDLDNLFAIEEPSERYAHLDARKKTE